MMNMDKLDFSETICNSLTFSLKFIFITIEFNAQNIYSGNGDYSNL